MHVLTSLKNSWQRLIHSTSFSSCTILRSLLSFGYHTNMAFACLLKFFGIQNTTLSATINNDLDA